MTDVPGRGVTALMPLRNGHMDYVRRGIQSMRNQSCPDWHLQIVVEKSDLKRFRRALEPELGDTRISMIGNEGRRLAGAMNTGMRNAPTDFVAILLADDMWATDAVQVLTEHVAAFPQVDFFHSSRIFIDELDKSISSVYHSRASFTLDDFLVGSPVKHLLCWRKAKALSFGGMDETMNFVGPDDCDFPWCMAEQGAVFMAIQEPLYLYRDHRASPRLTTHVPLSVHCREIRRILSKHGASEEVIQKRLARATASYLRQCLYKTRLEKWVKELVRYGARNPWRETYN